MPYESNGKCVTIMAAESVVVSCERVDFHDFLARLCTVVAFTGLHFRAFHLLTFAASHDLKERIDKDYCECGMPLEIVRESEAPLKERSERV